MRHLIECTRLSLAQKNWHAALASALIIPDVCAGLEHGVQTGASHYIGWCDEYFRPLFEAPPHTISISGNEIYVLRCSYLHSGSADVTAQRKSDILEHYLFVSPMEGWTFYAHLIPGTGIFQVPVDDFCGAICAASERWEEAVLRQREEVKRRSDALLRIFDPRKGLPLTPPQVVAANSRKSGQTSVPEKPSTSTDDAASQPERPRLNLAKAP